MIPRYTVSHFCNSIYSLKCNRYAIKPLQYVQGDFFFFLGFSVSFNPIEIWSFNPMEISSMKNAITNRDLNSYLRVKNLDATTLPQRSAF